MDTWRELLYDRIGLAYRSVRRADPRIEARIHRHLGSAELVLNVGAGSGSYEPRHRAVIAIEPSTAMIRQRAPGSAPVLRAVASHLPIRDRVFDAAMAVLTVHHWTDPIAGLTELRRVTRGPVVVFTFDKPVHDQQWLIAEYLPAAASLDPRHPSPTEIARVLGGGHVEVVPVPHDCLDGFCHAWWQRPAAYLHPTVRAGISGIARLPATTVARAMERLAEDLTSGTWQRRHHDLLMREEIDAGYRLVVSPGSGPAEGDS